MVPPPLLPIISHGHNNTTETFLKRERERFPSLVCDRLRLFFMTSKRYETVRNVGRSGTLSQFSNPQSPNGHDQLNWSYITQDPFCP